MTYTHDPLGAFKKCPECHAGLTDLVIGGVGDWQTSILCTRCHHVQKGVSFRHTIVPLVAEKYNLTEAAALEADSTSQEEYLDVLLGGPLFPDLPAVPPQARWRARRLAAAPARHE